MLYFPPGLRCKSRVGSQTRHAANENETTDHVLIVSKKKTETKEFSPLPPSTRVNSYLRFRGHFFFAIFHGGFS